MLHTQGDVVKWKPADVQRWFSTVGSGEHAYNFQGMTGQVSFCWSSWQAERSSVQMTYRWLQVIGHAQNGQFTLANKVACKLRSSV